MTVILSPVHSTGPTPGGFRAELPLHTIKHVGLNGLKRAHMGTTAPVFRRDMSDVGESQALVSILFFYWFSSVE